MSEMTRTKLLPVLLILVALMLLPALWLTILVMGAPKTERQIRTDRNVLFRQMPQKEVVESYISVGPSNYHVEPRNRHADPCEVIHIAVVCMNLESVQHASSLIKSIYMQRQNPVAFHFFTYAFGKKVLSVLMETWDVAEVTWTFNLISPKRFPRWVKKDFSTVQMKIYRLLKTVEKVIVLNTSNLVHCDIQELWRVFDDFNSTQVIAVTGKPKAGPIIGAEVSLYVYDFGVTLLHLGRIREDDLGEMLSLELKQYFFRSKSALFAEEREYLEIVLRNHTDMIYNLPCKWNVQLSDQERFCFVNESLDFKIINWNELLSTIANKDYLNSLRDVVSETNSGLLRRKTTVCYDASYDIRPPAVQVSNHSCRTYNKESQRQYKTQLFFWGKNTKLDSKEFEVTLVSHFGAESLSLLDKVASHWSGPMSVTAFLTDQEVALFKMVIDISKNLQFRGNVVFHLVVKSGSTYPAQYLNRVAFDQVETDYVFITDFDNLPMKAMYGDLRAHVTWTGLERMNKTALVVPGYISKLHKTRQPWTMVRLQEQMAMGQYAPANNLVKEGSRSLDDLSYSDGKSYNTIWHYGFEWSIVVSRIGINDTYRRFPDFNFYTGKYSRQALIVALYAAGYLFAPLSDLFVIRMPHSATEIEMKPDDQKLWERCLSWNWMEYLIAVSRNYDVEAHNLLKVFPLSSRME